MHDAALVVAIVNDILMTIYNDSVNLATAAGSHLILSFDTAPYEEQNSEKQNNFSRFSSNLFGSYSFFCYICNVRDGVTFRDRVSFQPSHTLGFFM